jgi:hypothetical protein
MNTKGIVKNTVLGLAGLGLLTQLACPWVAKKSTQDVYQGSIKFNQNLDDPNRARESVILGDKVEQLKGRDNLAIRVLYKIAPMYNNYINEIQDNWLGFTRQS